MFSPRKFARPVHNTPLNAVWGTVCPLIDDLLFSTIKRSYAINTARFLTVPYGKDVKDGTLGSVVIWITVHPRSTSANTAHEVSREILRLLTDNGVDGVDVEWSEAVTQRLASPALLPVVGKHDATAHLRRHLTTALSIPIAAARMAEKDGQGTGGFYFHENIDKDGNPSPKVLLVTNHHVLSEVDDQKYDFRADGSPRQQVRVCGSRRFEEGLRQIMSEVNSHDISARVRAGEIAELEAKVASGDGDKVDSLEEARQQLDKHQRAIVELEAFSKEVNASWGNIARRNIGVLDYSPPISVDVDNEWYTQDWGTVRLDSTKFRANFKGNIIDLGAIRLTHSNIDHLV